MVKYRFWILFSLTVLSLVVAHGVFVGTNLKKIESLTNELKGDVEEWGGDVAALPSEAMVNTRGVERARALGTLMETKDLFLSRDARDIDPWFEEAVVASTSKKPTREAFKRAVLLARDRLSRELDAQMADVSHDALLGKTVFTSYSWLQSGNLPPKRSLQKLQRTLNVEYAIHRIMAVHGARVTSEVEGSFEKAVPGADGSPFERTKFRFTVTTAAANVLEVLHAFDAPSELGGEEEKGPQIALSAHVDALTIHRLPIDTGNANRFSGDPPIRVEMVVTCLRHSDGGGL